MLGRTHAFTGLFVGLLLISQVQTTLLDSFLLVLITIFGSLFPDIDSPKSILGRYVKPIGWIFKHRGILHSVFPLAIIYFVVNYFFGFTYALAFSAGFISHILLDVVTREGVHIFPLGIHIRGPVRVGGFLEYIFLFMQLFFIVVLFY